MSKTVLLLQGGLSAEREVSLASAAPVQRALEAGGYRVIPFDPGWDVVERLPRALAGVDAVLSWGKSKRIEGAPWLCNPCYCREVRTSRFFPPFHANANARRSPPRFVSDSPRAVRVSRSTQHTEILTAAGATCVKCGSSETCTWNNSPDVPGGKVCMKCYHQDNPDPRRSKKKKK